MAHEFALVAVQGALLYGAGVLIVRAIEELMFNYALLSSSRKWAYAFLWPVMYPLFAVAAIMSVIAVLLKSNRDDNLDEED